MRIEIDKPHVEALIAKFPERAGLEAQLRFGERVELDLMRLTGAEFDFLEDLYRRSGPELHARAAQLATLRGALDSEGRRFEAADLEELFPALVRYLVTGGERGWLFAANIATKPLPYVVTRFDYVPASNDEAGKIILEIKANAKGTLQTNMIRIMSSDAAGRTIGEILAAKGFARIAGSARGFRRRRRDLSRLARALWRAILWQRHGLPCGRPQRHASRHRLGAQGCDRALGERRRGAARQ